MASTLPENTKYNERGQRIVKTEKGREIAADLVVSFAVHCRLRESDLTHLVQLLCTGQLPNTEPLAKMSPSSIDPNSKLAYVLPTMQLSNFPASASPVVQSEPARQLETELVKDVERLKLGDGLAPAAESTSTPSESESPAATSSSNPKVELHMPAPMKVKVSELPKTPYPHIFVVGDCADAFGATKAGHAAYWQAEVASRNIIRLAQIDDKSVEPAAANLSSEESDLKDEDDYELETYTPGPPAIKVSLGVVCLNAFFRLET